MHTLISLTEAVDAALSRYFSKEEELHRAARYSLEGGKRIRPLLFLSIVIGHGVTLDSALPFACALECIHTYSLIHDDLPCMDDDDLRRGKPTLHKAFSEGTAVLTGDFLLTFAFELAAPRSDCVTILARRSGQSGMIGGQMLDLMGSVDLWEQMAREKTAALFIAALEMGAVLANQSLAPFETIGENLGLAFQLYDDLADGDGTVLILGKDEVEKRAATYFATALQCAKALPTPLPLFDELCHSLQKERVP